MKILQAQAAKIAELRNQLTREVVREERITKLYESIDFGKIKKAFAKLGFVPTREFNCQFDRGEDFGKSPLLVDYYVQSHGSFKPIHFDGYTKSGAGRNHDRLVAKAEKLEAKLLELTGYKTYINHYGMEVKSSDKDFSFSIQFTIED